MTVFPPSSASSKTGSPAVPTNTVVASPVNTNTKNHPSSHTLDPGDHPKTVASSPPSPESSFTPPPPPRSRPRAGSSFSNSYLPTAVTSEPGAPPSIPSTTVPESISVPSIATSSPSVLSRPSTAALPPPIRYTRSTTRKARHVSSSHAYSLSQSFSQSFAQIVSATPKQEEQEKSVSTSQPSQQDPPPKSVVHQAKPSRSSNILSLAANVLRSRPSQPAISQTTLLRSPSLSSNSSSSSHVSSPAVLLTASPPSISPTVEPPPPLPTSTTELSGITQLGADPSQILSTTTDSSSPTTAAATATATPDNDKLLVDEPDVDDSASVVSSSSSSLTATQYTLSHAVDDPTRAVEKSTTPTAVGQSGTGKKEGKISIARTIRPKTRKRKESTVRSGKPANLPPTGKIHSKMHQTSSRLLRMTDDDRPFTRDFKDLFSTLIVSLMPLSTHRVWFTKVPHTFVSEDAINNLGSLKFSQSNRMPDPKDPSRIVTTTTTTTFSMAKEMARTICQRFVEARFIESADGKRQSEYTSRGGVWKLTSKGLAILRRFCMRNGIQQKQISEFNGMVECQIVALERNSMTDELLTDRGTMEVIFTRMAGIHGRNIKSSTSVADSDSLSDYRNGVTGVKMAAERKISGQTFRETFTGKAIVDWLMDCCTTVDHRETVVMASLFLQYGFIAPVALERQAATNVFHPSKLAIYHFTALGREVIEGTSESVPMSSTNPLLPSLHTTTTTSKDTDSVVADTSASQVSRQNTNDASYRGGDAGVENTVVSGGSSATSSSHQHSYSQSHGHHANHHLNSHLTRDSNTQRLDKILADPALRLLFREHLNETHCEENLSFFMDVNEFMSACTHLVAAAGAGESGSLSSASTSASASASTKPGGSYAHDDERLETIKEFIAQAYSMYNAYLAPGSPCELNIDHQLRNELSLRMTKVGDAERSIVDILVDIIALFEKAQVTVYKLMASDSVPKFLRTAKYDNTLRKYDFDVIGSAMSTPQIGTATSPSDAGSSPSLSKSPNSTTASPALQRSLSRK